MDNVIRIAKRLIPIEQIALFEPFIEPSDPPLRTTKEFKTRIVLINKSSVLSEETPEELTESNNFRFVIKDRIGTNPAVTFSVETFEPAANFQPTKPFRSRLLWNDRDGNARSRLLLTEPEVVLAVVMRGEKDSQDFENQPTRKAKQPRRAANPAKDIA